MSNWESKEAITNSFEFNVSLGRYGGYITRWIDKFSKEVIGNTHENKELLNG